MASLVHSFKRWRQGLAFGLALAISVVPCAGQASGCPAPGPRPSQAAFDACNRKAALKDIQQAVSEHYVFVERRAPIVARLQAAEKQGRYDLADPVQFAERVSADLREVSPDGHLYLRYSPGEYAAMLAPPKSDAGLDAYRRAQAVRLNHGLTEMRVLPGNIRYLKITGFKWVADGTTARAYDTAASFLREGDAIIIDLQGNGGGESDAADYFLSHIVSLGASGAQPKPVYVLVDRFTGSAAEAVSYDAKLRKTATIVGARTYGAANNNRLFPVAPAFVLSLSYNRPVHPLSGTNWEGVGVEPDMAIAPGLAVFAAQADAIHRLDVRTPAESPMKTEYAWRLVWLEAQLKPVKLDRDALVALAHTYGPIEIRYDDGALRLYRPDRPNWPQGALLSALANDLFAIDGTDDLRLRISRTELEILRPGGGSEAYKAAP